MPDTLPQPKPANIIREYGIDRILERIGQGEQQVEIADSLKVSPAILSWHLKQHPDHDRYVEAHHRRRIDWIDRLHDEAVDQRDFDLARAREAQAKRIYLRAGLEARAFSPTQRSEQHVQVSVSVDNADLARRIAYLSEEPPAIECDVVVLPSTE